MGGALAICGAVLRLGGGTERQTQERSQPRVSYICTQGRPLTVSSRHGSPPARFTYIVAVVLFSVFVQTWASLNERQGGRGPQFHHGAFTLFAAYINYVLVVRYFLPPSFVLFVFSQAARLNLSNRRTLRSLV